jgi:hypothetical protein
VPTPDPIDVSLPLPERMVAASAWTAWEGLRAHQRLSEERPARRCAQRSRRF